MYDKEVMDYIYESIGIERESYTVLTESEKSKLRRQVKEIEKMQDEINKVGKVKPSEGNRLLMGLFDEIGKTNMTVINSNDIVEGIFLTVVFRFLSKICKKEHENMVLKNDEYVKNRINKVEDKLNSIKINKLNDEDKKKHEECLKKIEEIKRKCNIKESYDFWLGSE